MKSQFNHDPRSGLAVDVLGSAIALAIVWGAFTTLFGEPSKLFASEKSAVVEGTNGTRVEANVAYDLYDSVMNTDEDWQMLASR